MREGEGGGEGGRGRWAARRERDEAREVEESWREAGGDVGDVERQRWRDHERKRGELC